MMLMIGILADRLLLFVLLGLGVATCKHPLLSLQTWGRAYPDSVGLHVKLSG